MAHKVPFATDEQVREAARAFPTPFYLYDEAGIRRRADEVAAAFAWNPGFREHFAVKANPNPAIVGILAERGCGVDCATGTELLLAREMGMGGDEVMFSSNETSDADYRLAHAMGAVTNLDDLTQLDHYLRACGSFAPAMSVRYNPGGTLELANGIQGEPEGSKFGMTHDQALEAIRRLADAGVPRLGVHAFLASNALGDDYYPALARMLFEFVVEVRERLGVRLSFVNLSGGVGVDYRPEEEPCDVARIGAGVRRAYEEVIGDPAAGEVAVLSEMGRFMLAPFGMLVTRVVGTKSTYREYLGCDACSADLMRPMLYDAYHHVTVVGRRDEPATRVYDIVGGLCENSDRLAHDRALPETREGDLLLFHDAGAHARAMGYNYNGMLRPAEVLLTCDGSLRLIRRAETAADYFATLDCLEIGKRLKEAPAWT